ncbi:MAG TPA: alanine racemase [Steroidobacteraceae bacterium]|nr:alanine racemase [Steroidobacteraceae bacterium]
MSGLIRAVIDTHALQHNLGIIRARAGRARVMAVVKANAYGHGLTATALALQAADAFGVARLEEGLALRRAGITQPIVLLEGVFDPQQLELAAQHRLDLVVHHALQVELLEHGRGTHRFVLWIKIDTGMNRLGFPHQEFAAALARVCHLTPAPLEIRLLTHLACANERDAAVTQAQLTRFRQSTRDLQYAVSIANSAGLFGAVPLGCDWVRPGLALYGASPFADCSASDLGLKPAMRLESSVIAVREVARGESVGYGGAWVAARDSRIAIIAAGYGDGLHRSLAGGTPVLVGGERAPLAGRVSMDMLAVDVSGLREVHIGTPAVLWGPGLPVEEVARHAGTIPYELLCAVSQRVGLVVCGGEPL